MIQEKDFLYRVPVKTAPITTPGGQIRNPEILVDVEGGEFMRGNILDANSTNKLINQSVKDAVDDKFIESGYVTKDLLEAETSARTKGDEDLGAKIQAEQTRAEGKEKEISDKLAIVDGDSNTEGSFRKAIATKADATALSNYVLTTALNQQVDTLNAAISAKQDAGNYIPYNKANSAFYYLYNIGIISQNEDGSGKTISCPGYFEQFNGEKLVTIRDGYVDIRNNQGNIMTLNKDDTDGGIVIYKQRTNSIEESLRILEDGIRLIGGDNNHVLTSNASTIDITQYALKTELPTVPTKTSQLTNDSNFITATDINVNDLASADDVSSLRAGLSRKQDKITVNEVDITDIETADITKLRTIVTNLINALSASDLIRKTKTLE